MIRQEAVSMVPAALLGIRPGHKLLDMCASPGSKTTQALEAIHGGKAEGGLVVANDTDARRARLLIRRCAALGELTARLAVTQHDATKFPNVLAPCWRDDGPGGTAAGANRYPDGPYDRVLCDVPCSGDGTLRKNPEVRARATNAFPRFLGLPVDYFVRQRRTMRMPSPNAALLCRELPVNKQ